MWFYKKGLNNWTRINFVFSNYILRSEFILNYEKQMNQYFGVFSKSYQTMVTSWLITTSYKKDWYRLEKFYAGEAVLMIEHMVKSGKIEQTRLKNIMFIEEESQLPQIS